mmetsp:Transcript_48583/g.104102  ORF Transcript_48583/g.104102 Transcript_48583/m.104102 type:complete len:203 (+) Transcript_48583:767-1375(+)
MGLQGAELLLEGQIPRLAMAVDSRVLDDVRGVVTEDVRRAVRLQGLAPEVKLAAAVGVVLHPEAVPHQELQVRRLRIVDAELLARHDVFRGHEAQCVLRERGRAHAGDHVVVEEVGQRDEHGALARALEGEAAGLHYTQRPTQILAVHAAPTPDAGRDLFSCKTHAFQVTKPVLHDVREEGRVHQLELPVREPEDVGKGHWQ